MRILSRIVVPCLAAVLLLLASAAAQLGRPVDDSIRTPLRGTVPSQARLAQDLGPVPPATHMRRMQLVLTRIPAQEAALAHLLDAQQDPHAPAFRQFLTPADFGRTFGPSDADLATLTTWLATHGFTAIQPNAGRTLIEFSGTAQAVRSAFHTEIQTVSLAGATYLTNLTDPDLPHVSRPARLRPGFAQQSPSPRRPQGTPWPAITRPTTPSPHTISPPSMTSSLSGPPAPTAPVRPSPSSATPTLTQPTSSTSASSSPFRSAIPPARPAPSTSTSSTTAPPPP